MRLIVPSLIGVALAIGVLVALRPPRAVQPVKSAAPRLAWVFEAPQPGSIVARPCITDEAIVVAATRTGGLHPSGVVYAVDPNTGKLKWTFDGKGEMLPTASSPVVADGRLFVGEGMHADFTCRLRCLDPANGHERWTFIANDHIEGGPVVSGGNVVFPAGNDGLYALDAKTGSLRWNFRADLHIDSTACVTRDRVFVGSGKSRRYQAYQVICIDIESGNPVWRTPVDLPAWGSPAVDSDRLYIGLGNGRLTESAQPPEKPAGALACFDAATGKHLWSFPAGDAVFGTPAVLPDRVIFGSRDGNLYGVSLDGREIFRVPMGGPVVAGVAVADGMAYAVSVPGRVVCLDANNGRELWRHELRRPRIEPQVFASPVIVGNRLYVAAEMTTGETGIVTLFCLDRPGCEGGGS